MLPSRSPSLSELALVTEAAGNRSSWWPVEPKAIKRKTRSQPYPLSPLCTNLKAKVGDELKRESYLALHCIIHLNNVKLSFKWIKNYQILTMSHGLT